MVVIVWSRNQTPKSPLRTSTPHSPYTSRCRLWITRAFGPYRYLFTKLWTVKSLFGCGCACHRIHWRIMTGVASSARSGYWPTAVRCVLTSPSVFLILFTLAKLCCTSHFTCRVCVRVGRSGFQSSQGQSDVRANQSVRRHFSSILRRNGRSARLVTHLHMVTRLRT
jgi:hypothetical protein